MCNGDTWYCLLSHFTCNENVPSKLPIPVHTSSNSFCGCFDISVLAFLSLSFPGTGRKYSTSLLFDKEVLSGLLLKFELLWLFTFVYVLQPRIEHSMSLLLTFGWRTSSGLLLKFELLPLFVYQLVLLFVLAKLLSGPVFAQHCSLPVLRMILAFSSFFVPIVLQFIFNMFNNSMSGMPNDTFSFLETTKKMHFLHLSLFSILLCIYLIV